MVDMPIEITKDPDNPLREMIICKDKNLRIRVYDTNLENPQFHEDDLVFCNDQDENLVFEILDPQLYAQTHGWDNLLYQYAMDWYLSLPRDKN